MSKNQKYFELLSAYLDKELSDEEISKIEKLLSRSEELRNEFAELKRVKNLTNKIERLPESPYLESNIMAELEKGNQTIKDLNGGLPLLQ